MPFKKVAPNRYKSPSGRTFTKKQVVAYYATDGFKNPVKPKESTNMGAAKKWARGLMAKRKAATSYWQKKPLQD